MCSRDVTKNPIKNKGETNSERVEAETRLIGTPLAGVQRKRQGRACNEDHFIACPLFLVAQCDKRETIQNGGQKTSPTPEVRTKGTVLRLSHMGHVWDVEN